MIAGLLNVLFIAQDAEIIRTRDPAELAECDIVVDVGGEFDPKRHLYDHHQRYEFPVTMTQILSLLCYCIILIIYIFK